MDFARKAKFDAANMDSRAVNAKIRETDGERVGSIRMENPGAKHSLAVGILSRLRLTIAGSLGYFGCGLIDGPVIHVEGASAGRAGKHDVRRGGIAKNAGSTFGAASRGGDLVCRGDVGARTGICMKGGTILVGGRAGAFSGFMMQRGEW